MTDNHLVMLEHEDDLIAVGGLANRSTKTLFNILEDDLPRTFLCKKFEVNFSYQTLPIAVDELHNLMLGFRDNTNAQATTFGAGLDADLANQAAHRSIIWARQFVVQSFSTGATTEAHMEAFVMNTSKSFPKGMPLKEHDAYNWQLINVGATITTGAIANLRVRYWGVWL